MLDEEENVQLPLELSNLTTLVEERIENFAIGDKDLQDAALRAAKFIFDLTLEWEPTSRPHLQELLDQIDPAQAPQTRAQTRALAESGSWRKKTISHALLQPTPLSSLFIDGMDEDQVWAQLDLKAKNVCDTLVEAFDAGDMDARGMRDLSDDDDDDDDDDGEEEEESEEGVDEDMDGIAGAFAEGQWEMDDDDNEGEEEEEEGEEEEQREEEEDSDDDLNEENGVEKVEELKDPSEEGGSEEDDEGDDTTIDLDAPSSSKRSLQKRQTKSRHPELDDDFFNLADFNAEVMEAESKSVSRGALSKDSDEDDSDDEEGVDLFAPVDNVEAFEEEDMEEEAGEAYYKDFFEAPPKPNKKRKAESSVPRSKPSKVRFHEEVKIKTIKSRGKGLKLSEVDRVTQGPSEDDDDDYEPGDSSDSEGEDESTSNALEDEDVDYGSGYDSDELGSGREAVERLKDDLFADDDDDASKLDVSTHEARMAALREQIAALEAENVGEKDWVLKGEVTSRARPQNGLLEEDLEFERVMKPVPVVSEEVVQDLEARIKARIIEGRFDDVERKRAVDDKPFLPSRIIELQDTKSKESLAQIYENEFVATQTGGTMDDRDGKLRKEHEEIEKLWEGICYKLDALCNAHFTPKQPKATISTIANVSAVSLESALPTAKATSTILAPEEVFASNPTDLRAKSELTPVEKQSLRAKERRKKKKQRDILEKSVDKFAKANGMRGMKKQKEAALKSVVKNGKGVTVIGKKSQELKKGKKSSQS